MILRVAAGAFALLFALAAGLQFNDPDPLVWSLLYAAVAVASVRVAAGGRGAAREGAREATRRRAGPRWKSLGNWR